jgi:magnesium-transporting ATPase (P-type)
MDKSTYIGIACGLIVLGFAFTFMDFFTIKLLKKNPADSPLQKNETRKSLENHKLRKGGILVIGIGLLIFFIVPFVGSSNLNSSADFKTRIGDVLSNFQQIQKAQTPWGRIDIVVTIALSLASAALFFEGFWLRKKRPNTVVWLLAIILAVIVLLEGIFQWG